jgi:hypothetical protein
MADTRNIPKVKYNAEGGDRLEIKSKWWEQKDELHPHIFAVVKRIREAQAYRSLNNLRFARLYQNMELLGLQAGLHARVHDPNAFIANRVSYNVIKSCIDTAASKIAKNKPRPLYLTDDGNWSLQRKAMKLTSYMEGAFDSMGTGKGDQRTLYGISRRSWVDSAILGTGCVKFFADETTSSVKAERVIAEEIIVDESEGLYEGPRQLHQEKLVFREVLVDMVDKKLRDKVMTAQSGLPPDVQSTASADMIKVVESWHLPSSPGAADGKKAICIENCDISVDAWDKDYFPFLFHRWGHRLLGFYGSGLAEELIGIQLEINKLLRTIAIAQHLMSVPQVWLEVANKTQGKQINNEIGGIKYYSGQKPEFFVPQAMSQEVYAHLENLYNKAYQVTGISMLSAASQKPAGLDSRVALREFQDIESDRFQLVGQRYEDWFMDAADMVGDLMDDLEKAGKKPRVRVAGTTGSRDIAWSEVKIDRQQLRIRPFPTSILPSQPAGKVQKVQELMQAGFFDKEEGLELLDFPDLKAVVSVKVAARRDIKRMIEAMTEDGRYESPEPFMALELGRQLSQSYYLAGRADGMPEDRLELLRRFMDDCQALIDRSKEQAAAGGAAAGAASGAAPQPDTGAPVAQPDVQPRSDLMPVA